MNKYLFKTANGELQLIEAETKERARQENFIKKGATNYEYLGQVMTRDEILEIRDKGKLEVISVMNNMFSYTIKKRH